MLVDGGSGLNLISTAIFKRMQIPEAELRETGTFQGSESKDHQAQRIDFLAYHIWDVSQLQDGENRF